MAASDRRISIADRVRALDRLDELAWEANKMAAWLSDAGIETEADMIDRAARDLLAAARLLSRPVRAQPGPAAWQDGRASPDGYVSRR